MMLEALLSAVSITELWDNVTSIVPLVETVIGSVVNNTQAETGDKTLTFTQTLYCCFKNEFSMSQSVMVELVVLSQQ